MEYTIVQSFSNYIEANIMLGRMKDEGIECWLKNENTSTIMPVWNNAIGGIQLMVENNDLERATAILKEIKAAKRASMVCPACKSQNVEFINTMRKPVNWLSATVTFIFGDVALMPEQRFHCFSCEHEWKEEENA